MITNWYCHALTLEGDREHHHYKPSEDTNILRDHAELEDTFLNLYFSFFCLMKVLPLD